MAEEKMKKETKPSEVIPESTKSKPIFQLTQQVGRMKTSATLEMSRIVGNQRSQGKEIVNFGLGQSPFGPPQTVKDALTKNAHRTDYLPTEGIYELRSQIAHFYNRYFEINCNPEQIIVGPGSKELIFNTMAALNSPWLFVSPSWVSYETQAKMLGKKSWRAFIKSSDEFRISEKVLRKKLELIDDNLEGQTLAMLINYPNNPTGMTLKKQEVKNIARFARNNEIIILSDEIYANVTHPSFGEKHHSFALEYPEGTIVTGGISKDRSMGGYRLGVAIVPEEEEHLVNAYKSIGSETYSSVAAPIQYAVIKAYENTKDVNDHISLSTEIHELIGNVVHNGLQNVGFSVPRPEGAFYLFPSLNQKTDTLNNSEIYNSKELVTELILKYNVAVIPGTAFGLRPDDLSFRIAYIDYSGPEVMHAYKKDIDKAKEDPVAFMDKYCPNILKGIENLQRFVNELE